MTTTTNVCHVNDHIEGAVYIGRANGRKKLAASPFANPHKVKGDRQLAIDMYEIDITEGPLRPLLADLPALRDKPLACWCRHDGVPWSADLWCHGDVLVSLLNDNTDDELRAMAAAPIPLHWCQTCNQPMNAGRFADGIDEHGVEFGIWESYCTRCDPDTPRFPPQDVLRRARCNQRISLRDAGDMLGLSPSEVSAIEMGRDQAEPEVLEAMAACYGPFCRVCGCTDEAACEGGCYWIEPDLCSACAVAEGIPPDEPEWRKRQRVRDLEDQVHELQEAVAELQGVQPAEGHQWIREQLAQDGQS
jgi:transcriptional regulator with XRE-family HTH domain